MQAPQKALENLTFLLGTAIYENIKAPKVSKFGKTMVVNKLYPIKFSGLKYLIVNKYPFNEKAVPSSKGHNVIIVQYNVILVVILLCLLTLKIKLKLFSIVESNKIAVTAIPTTPTVVNFEAAPTNSIK